MVGMILADTCLQIVDCEHKTAPIDEAGEYFAVGTPAMRGNVINYAEARPINRETFKVWTARLRPKEGDLLLAREAPVGPIVRIPAAENIAPGQRTVLLRIDETVADSRFLSYYLSSPRLQADLLAKASGSTVPHLNVADVRTLPMPGVPSLLEQRMIGELLGALDDKIAANGHALSLLDEWIRSAFKGLIGESRPLGVLASNVRDQLQPSEVAAGTVYLGLEHLPKRRMWALEAGTSSEVTSAKSAFRDGDVLFGKLRPYFHKVVSACGSGICSTDILVVRAVDPGFAGFVLAACASDDSVRACTAASEGTRMPRTSWKDLSAVLVTWPGDDAARRFSSQVSVKSRLAHALVGESRRLAQARDELLPLLMSGRVRVMGAEKIVEEVV
jgi:type I restriction enzyme, S subunit